MLDGRFFIYKKHFLYSGFFMSNSEPAIDPAALRLGQRVVEMRQNNGQTLDQLASASGVSRSMLSQIERGKANPTLAVTYRIAQSFGLSIGEMVDDPSLGSPIEVVHGSDPGNLFRDDEECRIRTLSPLHMEKNVEFYELVLAPGAALSSAPHFVGTRELLTVTAGRAAVVTEASESALNVGDSAYYRADVAHSVSNPGCEQLRAFLVVTYS
ncbi:transcriptional regulator, XRE family with cupin sensor domain [Luminiphilus syltensis NOR5-1B]|uniref:Transcriptional regulator, XRE family with cupin sensor domain n=2 Tax=Luminiphilus TaxID=1341118 RepID=B8KY40_9GAMM|nr:transcriptional regulator, XRE family with cupin sensor domain [Luminiphilus syltensis NOR5-1B]